MKSLIIFVKSYVIQELVPDRNNKSELMGDLQEP